MDAKSTVLDPKSVPSVVPRHTPSGRSSSGNLDRAADLDLDDRELDVREAAPDHQWGSVAKSTPWIAIVDFRPCRREFVLNFLHSQKQLSERFAALSLNELLGQRDTLPGGLALIVCSIGGLSVTDPEVSVHFEQILAHYPTVPIVILSDLGDREEVRFALAAGARGFVSTLLDPQLMCAALRLVRAGGKFAPPELFDEWMRPRAEVDEIEPAAEAMAQHSELTPRQTHVLQLLQQGFPNKVIAAKLGMTESTVKVHVRQIMRRLGAKNRTEAALLAQRHPAPVKRTVC